MNRRHTAVAAVLTSTLALAACAPGSNTNAGDGATAERPATEVNTDPASMGEVTLTVWDQEVRGGQEKQISTLNEQFQAKYPNITINRVSRSFDDLTKTLRQALTGNDAPDIVQANNTRSQMGEFVKAQQIVNLDPYADTYKWKDRFPASVQALVAYSPDATTFGEGSIFGLPQVGEVVGVYYNKAKMNELGIEVPTTWDDFEKSLETAKGVNETPLVLGNLDKWPAVHVFGVLQGRYESADAIRTLAYGQPGGDWSAQGNIDAGTKLVEWVDKGYFNNGFNGEGYDPAWQKFSNGEGLYLIAGSWLQADLSAAMKGDVGFMLPPAGDGGTAVTTGGSGLPFAITANAKNPDAAAAYIDFITNDDAMKVLADNGNMPIVDTAQYETADPLGTEIFDAFGTVSSDDGLVPYLDWATPTMGDTIGAALQDMLAKKQTPQQAMETIGKDYTEFTSK